MADKKQAKRQVIDNAAKTLLANIRFSSPDKPIRSIAITSAVPEEGKTTTAIELGRTIAESGKSVIMVETDIRKRGLSARLATTCPAGMFDVMTGNTRLEEAVAETPDPGMFLLDVEPGIPNPTDVIASESFKQLVIDLSARYDYVIFDTPPVATFVDAAIVASLVDAAILVVRMDFTKRQVLQDAYEQLRKSGANVIGTVASCVKEIGSSSYYKHYSGYSKGNPAASGDAASRFSLDKIETAAKADAACNGSQASADAGPTAGAQDDTASKDAIIEDTAETSPAQDDSEGAGDQKPADAQAAATEPNTQDVQQAAAEADGSNPNESAQEADLASADQPAADAADNATSADTARVKPAPKDEPVQDADNAAVVESSPATKPKKLFSSARKNDDDDALHAMARHSKPAHTKKKR
ncbi:MAG: polysaccharide biosynthesis tyrosine autokinase [Coriobacteriaceae bacterium]|nr:polysaccharide biosynthesis tyrosine autokinase [Coriobacteriaceae bacterium]